MYEISQPDLPVAFEHAWICAGRHLEHQAGGGLSWLRAALTPPLADHLSFRLGNQIVFVFVEVDGLLEYAGRPRRLFEAACAEARAVPCVMPMRVRGEEFATVLPGWGLRHAETGALVDPAALVSDERVVMTDWELHDFAVQMVRQHVEEQGHTVLSSQSSREADPSLWYEDAKGRHFVVVRAARYPRLDVDPPDVVTELREMFQARGYDGFYAVVRFEHVDAPREADGSVRALYRGHPIEVNVQRFEAL